MNALEFAVAPDDPRTPDVVELLEQHLAFARRTSPPGHVHALDLQGLLEPQVTFVSARADGLLGVGALKELDPRHGELKSMHTLLRARGRGVGRGILLHLLGVARDRGYTRVSLETGAMEGFAPARALYASVGFERCAPFAAYTSNPHSVCMTLVLGRA